MGGIDHHHVDPGVDQRLAALEALVADGRGGGDAQAAQLILAGMRVSAVMLVSVITLTAYIGVESLGTLILQGIARMDANPLLIGSGLSAILAIAVNQAIVIVENLAMRRVGVRS